MSHPSTTTPLLRTERPSPKRESNQPDPRWEAFLQFLRAIHAHDISGTIQAQRDLRRHGISVCLTSQGADR